MEDEFIYFNKLDDKEFDKVYENFIIIDPGKKTLFTMMDKKGKFLSYTNKQRLYESKRLKFQKYREKYKNSTDIKSLEQQLNHTNGKSCDIEKFSEYRNKKNKILYELVDKYMNSQFRKLKWYGYLNTKRSEDRLLNRIEYAYGKDVNIIIGDWSIGHHMKNFISTPMIGLKRKLKSRFKVFNIDEYRT